MAKCELSIELDEPNRVYHEGEKVQGVAHVKVDSTVKCTGLVLSTGWKTHGRGNVTSGPAEETTVFSGQWTQGNKYEYRFSLSAGETSVDPRARRTSCASCSMDPGFPMFGATRQGQ